MTLEGYKMKEGSGEGSLITKPIKPNEQGREGESEAVIAGAVLEDLQAS